MAFDKLNGFYRGEVLQHVPSGMGMCKVFVFGVYPDEWRNAPDKLPPAEQASPLFAGANAGNGVFSYPNVGATVWCFFANGDQNYPVYFASSLGGGDARMRWDEAKCNTTAETIGTGDDAYVHKIDVNRTTVKLWESGYAEIITRFPKATDDSAGYFEGDPATMGQYQGEDTAKIVLDGKGNVIVSSTQLVQVTAPAIKISAEDKLDISAPMVKIDAGQMMEVSAPIFKNENSTSNTVKAPSIDINASAGMVSLKGKRHSDLVN